jgi:hypothetical protein
MLLMLLVTVLATTAALSLEEDKLGDLWSMENRPHPWPWPGSGQWLITESARPSFDFGPVFARTAGPRWVAITPDLAAGLQDICHALAEENAMDHPVTELPQ